MNNNPSYRPSRQDRYEESYGRQTEQFSDSGDYYDDGDSDYRQMGEGSRRRNYGQDSSERGYGRQNFGESGGRSRSYAGPEDTHLDRGTTPFRGGYGGRDSRESGQNYGRRDVTSDAYGAYRARSTGMGEYGGRSVGQGRYGGSDERGDVSRSSGRANRGDWNEGGEDRGFFDRASDEVASWFGDEEATRRREQDHRGRGPVNYRRSDERILEDACDHLTEDRYVDASNIQVTVLEGEVTLDGTVGSRQQKRRAEDCVHDLSGVKHVQNNLRIQERDEWSRSGSDQTSRTSSDTTPGTLA